MLEPWWEFRWLQSTQVEDGGAPLPFCKGPHDACWALSRGRCARPLCEVATDGSDTVAAARPVTTTTEPGVGGRAWGAAAAC